MTQQCCCVEAMAEQYFTIPCSEFHYSLQCLGTGSGFVRCLLSTRHSQATGQSKVMRPENFPTTRLLNVGFEMPQNVLRANIMKLQRKCHCPC